MAEAAPLQTPAAAAATVLSVKGLQAWYNESHILHGVDLDVREGEVVTLLGRNGAGKTTTLKSIMGIVGKRNRLGRVRRRGADRPARSTASPALGIALLPGGARHIRQPRRQGEPAAAAADRAGRRDELERIFALFPNLRERLAQRRRQAFRRRAADAGDRAASCAPARGFLLLDEPTEGLAPVIIQQIGRTIARAQAGRASPSCWSSRISASPRPWPTAISSWSTAGSSTPSPIPSLPGEWTGCTRRWGCDDGLIPEAGGRADREPLRPRRSACRSSTASC